VRSWSGMLLFVRSALNLWSRLLGSDAADACYGNWPCSMRYTLVGFLVLVFGPFKTHSRPPKTSQN